MKYTHIEFELSEGAGIVWLNRPEVHNAMNEEMITEIVDAFSKAGEMPDVRYLVIRGKGKSFCAGADLNYMKGIAQFGFDENYQDGLKLAKCFNVIYNCPKPTVAIVHGAAIGGANGLLAACDLVYCLDDTKFAFSEVKLGIAPATISPYVCKRIGEYGARDLMLTGRRFLGKEAEKQGLVNQSFETQEALDEQMAFTRKMLMSSGPAAMEATKKLIYNLYNKYNFEDSIDYTAKLIAELRASEEGQEGMASFLEKRKPRWNE
jgi:methylglutaconyl-CoA hydratase